MSDSKQRLYERISELASKKECLLVAVDGNSGAGKTTFSDELNTFFNCNVFHMDDFFLRPEQKNPVRLSEPGGNVDYERFLKEVITPLKSGRDVIYKRYDCKTQTILPPETISFTKINIIEGSYSLHPELYDSYDIRVFLSINPDEQMKRIIMRNGEKQAVLFRDKWIVLENIYFEAFHIRENCDFIF